MFLRKMINGWWYNITKGKIIMASWFEVNRENIKTVGFVFGILTGNAQAYQIGKKLDEYTRAIIQLQSRQETNQKDIERVEVKADKNSAYILEIFRNNKTK